MHLTLPRNQAFLKQKIGSDIFDRLQTANITLIALNAIANHAHLGTRNIVIHVFWNELNLKIILNFFIELTI